MGYIMKANNENLDDFESFGGISWSIFIEECCGTLFPLALNSGRYYCAFGVDERMPKGDDYPNIISGNGFEVTELESKIMARMAKNYVSIQNSLDNSHIHDRNNNDAGYIKPFPIKNESNFPEIVDEFSKWLNDCNGFKVCD